MYGFWFCIEARLITRYEAYRDKRWYVDEKIMLRKLTASMRTVDNVTPLEYRLIEYPTVNRRRFHGEHGSVNNREVMANQPGPRSWSKASSFHPTYVLRLTIYRATRISTPSGSKLWMSVAFPLTVSLKNFSHVKNFKRCGDMASDQRCRSRSTPDGFATPASPP